MNTGNNSSNQLIEVGERANYVGIYKWILFIIGAVRFSVTHNKMDLVITIFLFLLCVIFVISPSKIYKNEDKDFVLMNGKVIKSYNIVGISAKPYGKMYMNYGFGTLHVKTVNHSYYWFDVKDCEAVKRRMEHAIEVKYKELME